MRSRGVRYNRDKIHLCVMGQVLKSPMPEAL